MTEDKSDIPFRSPIAEAKDLFMVLIGTNRDGDIEIGRELATKIRQKLEKANNNIEGMIKRYSSEEPGQGDLGGLDQDEVDDLKKKYDLP